ncbi:MAG: class I SAM-dependent methyltransferase [Gammaproteobacteria bacterium]|nr:class I SAM-dependent methyltransferase [Gammaproteobacteria bacterium]MBU1415811.1 class I SAM-dependent methyltransferase [Gammaproteobacteria bacterium]
MKTNKDHFSGHAADYAKFRPGYPEALFDWIAAQTPGHDLVWDCGCGNGQASLPLAERYRRVAATDFSAEQIAQAAPDPHIEYRVAAAESSGLPDHCADVVTIAQALHWFDFDRFYPEVRRVVKPGGLIVAWTYQLLRGGPTINALLDDFYRNTLGPHWPPERKWVDLAYQGMPFPFEEIAAPPFEIHLRWTLADLLAYLGTWSATRRCIKAEGRDPMPALSERLAPYWGEGAREIVWPIILKAGHV